MTKDLWQMHVLLKQQLDARQDSGNLRCYWTLMCSPLALTLNFLSELLIVLYSGAHSTEVSHAIYCPWSCQKHMDRADRTSIQCHLKHLTLFH